MGPHKIKLGIMGLFGQTLRGERGLEWHCFSSQSESVIVRMWIKYLTKEK